MSSVWWCPELVSTLGIEDVTKNKDYGRYRGASPTISEAQGKDIDKLNKRLNAKSSAKMKKMEDDDEVLASFDLKSAPRAILHSAPFLKRNLNSLMQTTSRRYGYLLNDVLLLTSVPSGSSERISLHQVLFLDQISIVDLKLVDSNEDPAAFEIRTPDRPYQLIAESENEKKIWLEELEAAMFSYLASKPDRTPGWHLKVVRGSLASAAYLGDINLLQKLLDRKVGESLDGPDDAGMTVLHWACIGGDLNAVRLLLDYGASMDVLNGGLNSALLIASALGFHSIVLFLLNYGADIEIRNLKDFDCLLMAVIFGNYTSGLFEMVQVLKLRGLDINKEDISGATPLHQCTARNLTASIQILVDAGADVNAKHGRSGLTPLQLACSGHCPDAETVRILLDKGAMANWKDMAGKTAFDMLITTYKNNAGSKFADTSSQTGLKSTVDEVEDFCTTVLIVLVEIARKGGRFEQEMIQHLRASFQESIESGRQCWLQVAEPPQFGEFIRSRSDVNEIFANSSKWTADNASQGCLICLDKWTMSNRRHHCRSCGVLCCDNCSSKRLRLPLTAGSKVSKGKADGERVCDSCFNRLLFACSEWTQALNTAKKIQRMLEKAQKEEADRQAETLRTTSSTGSLASIGSRSPLASTGRGVASANSAAAEAHKALEERGQRVAELAERTEQMREGAESFRKMARTLHQQLQAKNSGW